MIEDSIWRVPPPFFPKGRPNPTLRPLPPEFFELSGMRIFQWKGPVRIQFSPAVGQMQSLQGSPTLFLDELQLFRGCRPTTTDECLPEC